MQKVIAKLYNLRKQRSSIEKQEAVLIQRIKKYMEKHGRTSVQSGKYEANLIRWIQIVFKEKMFRDVCGNEFANKFTKNAIRSRLDVLRVKK